MPAPELPHGFRWERHLVAGSHDYGDLNLVLDGEWIATIRLRNNNAGWASAVRRYADYPYPWAVTKTREAAIYYVTRWTIAHEAMIRDAVAEKLRRRREADPLTRQPPRAPAR